MAKLARAYDLVRARPVRRPGMPNLRDVRQRWSGPAGPKGTRVMDMRMQYTAGRSIRSRTRCWASTIGGGSSSARRTMWATRVLEQGTLLLISVCFRRCRAGHSKWATIFERKKEKRTRHEAVEHVREARRWRRARAAWRATRPAPARWRRRRASRTTKMDRGWKVWVSARYEELLYEGYAAGVHRPRDRNHCTDNRNRAGQEVRHAFTRNNRQHGR